MLRISKLTDYALVILASMQENELLSATAISQRTHIPLATTNKVLKQLSQFKICHSKSGKFGGFILSRKKKEISLLEIVRAMEGQNTSLTECSNQPHSSCQIKQFCKINEKLNLIDREINLLLAHKFLSDIS